MASEFTRYFTLIGRPDEPEVLVQYTVTEWGSSPVVGGPPEACDPGDPMEIEIDKVFDSKGNAVTLTPEEDEKITQAICENPPEYPEPDYD